MNDTLKQIDHIVVLMLENRSFDHMLGYLRLEDNREDIDGLTGNEVNEHDGERYSPQLLLNPVFEPDPNHHWDNVTNQLEGDNGGFVRDFASTGARQPERIMHYHNATLLHSYDHLAKQFCICDRWFSSVPGPTQPNRIYALAGHSDGEMNNLTRGQLAAFQRWDVKPIFDFLRDDGSVTWRYYSHDIAALRFIRGYDGYVEEIDKINRFFASAERGSLPKISWIDPDFNIPFIYSEGPPNSDHPPDDVQDGQNLVSKVYNALLTAPNDLWLKTLLIVTYDEHGGFYDHVSPQQWTPVDDRKAFQRYGVRVPAFVISPCVGKQVAYGSQHHHLRAQDVIFDHTSILKTIIVRFFTLEGRNPPDMVARVAAANDLSGLLTETKPRTDCTPAPVTIIRRIGPPPVSLGPPSELQQSLEALANEAIAEGVPPDKL